MSDQINNPPKPPQTFSDVTVPGKSAPSAFSKPIIVSNRPPQSDPMMSRVGLPKDIGRPAAVAQPVPIPPQPHTEPQKPATPPEIKPGEVSHRLRTMLILIIGLLVLFVAVDLLVDANVIHTSVTPLTNFFHHH